jgi:N-acyl-L-homoserine lactone synthetase
MMDGMARYRHRVFIEKLGWDLDCSNGLEIDQFDREDTVYVLGYDEADAVIGTARLLPTTGAYLLGEVFPQLLNGAPVPASPEIWELSRFAAVDFNTVHFSPLKQFSSPLAVAMLDASMDCARAHGVKELITVSPLGVERLLARAGYRVHRAGVPVMQGGHPIVALRIQL